MKLFITLGIIALYFVIPVSNVAANEQQNTQVCSKLKIAKGPVAYLIKEDGQLNAGPINMGEIAVKDSYDKEGYPITTGYKVVVSPSNLAVQNPIPGSIYYTELQKTKNICTRSQTYEVVLKWNIRPGLGRPFQFKDHLPIFTLEDKYGYDQEIDDIYRFDPTVTGKLVEPK